VEWDEKQQQEWQGGGGEAREVGCEQQVGEWDGQWQEYGDKREGGKSKQTEE